MESAYASFYYNLAIAGKVVVVSFYNAMTVPAFQLSLAAVIEKLESEHPDTKALKLKAFVDGGEHVVILMKHGSVFVEATEAEEWLLIGAQFEV